MQIRAVCYDETCKCQRRSSDLLNQSHNRTPGALQLQRPMLLLFHAGAENHGDGGEDSHDG